MYLVLYSYMFSLICDHAGEIANRAQLLASININISIIERNFVISVILCDGVVFGSQYLRCSPVSLEV